MRNSQLTLWMSFPREHTINVQKKKNQTNKRPESYRSHFFKTTQVKKIEEELFCMGNEKSRVDHIFDKDVNFYALIQC